MFSKPLSAGILGRRPETAPRHAFLAPRQPGTQRARQRIRPVATFARLAASRGMSSDAASQRRALAGLDDHLLRDIGLL